MNKKNIYRPILILTAFFVMIIIGVFFIRFPEKENRSFISMNTAVTMTIYKNESLYDRVSVGQGREEEADGGDFHKYGKATDMIDTKIDYLDSLLLDRRDETSECYRFNTAAGKSAGFEMSEDFLEVTGESLRIARMTGGAVDPTLAALVDLWDIEGHIGDEDFLPPSEEEREGVRNDIGFENISLKDNMLYCENDALGLDFGAFGKGYALDKIYEELAVRDDVTGGVVAIGGSILAFGSKGGLLGGGLSFGGLSDRQGRFEIGIRNPEKGMADSIGTIRQKDAGEVLFVSTSGSYERYAESADGKVYSHIMSRETMAPVDNDLLSVTVVSPRGIDSDALSTACFIAGQSEALEILEKFDSEAVFVYRDHSVYVTEGLRSSFELTSEDYKLK